MQKINSAIMMCCRTLLLAVVAISPVARATSVIEVSLDQMLQHSALVFEGQVTRVQVRENGRRDIQTLVTFEIIDVIKGEVKGKTITLGFLGGQVADRKLSVMEMQMPELNERGIYFVESPARNQVHPLYGWSQGHLRLEQDTAGTERVLTRSGRPVRGVEHTHGTHPGRLSNGAARGLIMGDSTDISTALDRQAFKQRLRAMR